MTVIGGQWKWHEAKSRPIQGNSLNDRILRGPGCNRYRRVCVDFFSATPLPWIPETSPVPGRRFSGMAESFDPMWLLQTGVRVPPPVGRPWSPAKERDGRSALSPSSAMSSGRLFLDRGARQHCPSPLHRQSEYKRWTDLKKGFIIER